MYIFLNDFVFGERSWKASKYKQRFRFQTIHLVGLSSWHTSITNEEQEEDHKKLGGETHSILQMEWSVILAEDIDETWWGYPSYMQA